MAPLGDIGRHGTAIAIVTERGERVTYAALGEYADALRPHLAPRGLAFLLLDNREEAVVGLQASFRTRTPAALLSATLPPAQLAELVARYQPRYVWLPHERAAEVGGARELHRWRGYVLLGTGAPAVPLHPELALLLTTSGSTGSPKFVRQSYRNLSSNAAAISEYLGITAQDRAVTTLPMHYVYGLSVVNSHLLRGATVVLTTRSLTEQGFWDVVRREGATSFAGVPFTYELLRRLRLERMDVPSLRVLTQAGGKLDARLVREFAELCGRTGRRFFVMYGASEATARMAYLPPERAIEKPGSIGIAIPGGELWLEDEHGAVLEGADQVGELVYRGENVTLGYATSPDDLARGDERGGVLRTGDLARRDADGFYYVVGRRSRFLKIFGNRVNLEELEHHIRRRGVDCACAGEDDRLRVYVNDEARVEEVKAFVHELTRLHHSAYRVVVIPRIPRNEAGKIQYAELP
jgi:acyl-coenzyme A synthetase/AMP-(fatty) acid ligase